MDRHRIFANNLTAIQGLRQMSIAEFAKEIGIPPSTWQAVLKDGNTTLNTAIRISEGVGVSLDKLTGDDVLPARVTALGGFMQMFSFYCSLSAEQQDVMIEHLRAILELLHK